MPLALEGSCRCNAVRFRCASSTPVPYQRCYCSICRKTAGGGGYAINLGGIAASLSIDGAATIAVFNAPLGGDDGCPLTISPAQRHFCSGCATALWLFDPRWPELLHPFASAIDTALPKPPSLVHLMLRWKPDWVVPAIGPQDECFDEYPTLSLEEWHRAKGLLHH